MENSFNIENNSKDKDNLKQDSRGSHDSETKTESIHSLPQFSSNKFIQINFETINKTINFLKLLLEDFSNTEKVMSTYNLKKELIQITKEFSVSLYSVSDKNNEFLYSEIEKLNNDIKDYKKKLIEMNSLYEQSANDNKNLIVKMQNYYSIKEDLESHISQSKIDVKSKDKKIEILENKVKTLEKTILKYERLVRGNADVKSNDEGKEMEDEEAKISISTNKDFIIENPSIIDIIKIPSLGKSIFSFLNLKDLILFKNTSKAISNITNNNSKLDYVDIITKSIMKNSSIKNTTNLNLISNNSLKYNTLSDDFVNSIIKENTELVSESKGIPGIDLKKQIMISLNFLERNVKIPLGLDSILIGKQLDMNTLNINSSTNTTMGSNSNFNNTANTNNKEAFSLFKSVKNMFDTKVNKQNSFNNSNNKETTSISNNNNFVVSNNNNNMSNNSQVETKKYTIYDNDIRNNLLLEHLSKLNLQFEYNSVIELKDILNKVYNESEGFTKEFLEDFGKELINVFSNLLFIANQSLLEIKETDLIKEISKERYLTCMKTIKELEIEVEQLRSYNKTAKEIKEILSNQKNELEIKYSSCRTEMIVLQQNLEQSKCEKLRLVSNYEKLKGDFDNIKNKLVKEYLNIKRILENNISEKKDLINNIIDFKNFFMKYSITEDGEVLFSES